MTNHLIFTAMEAFKSLKSLPILVPEAEKPIYPAGGLWSGF